MMCFANDNLFMRYPKGKETENPSLKSAAQRIGFGDI
jgi:hypothetical protein